MDEIKDGAKILFEQKRRGKLGDKIILARTCPVGQDSCVVVRGIKGSITYLVRRRTRPFA